jgi:hypothetical protein
MNKLFVFLPLVLIAFVLPASASAGQVPPPGMPAENQFYCGPDAQCEPPTDICVISNDEDNPLPAQENCVWPEDPCFEEEQGCPPVDDSCMLPPGEPLPEECVWPDDPCIDDPKGCEWPLDPCVTNWNEDGSVPDDCEDFPPHHCYVEDPAGEEGESSPGDSGESAEPDFPVCIYDVAPLPPDKGKGRAEARKERAQARREAARKRAQARRKAARKRAAIKRQKMKAKAKKAAKARNS